MKLSEIKQVLSENRIRLTKSLGQNFLFDANQLRRIVALAELTQSDKVLEIGPGLGPLTELLLENAGEVLAVEKDARLVEILRKRFAASLRAERGHSCPQQLPSNPTLGVAPKPRLQQDVAADRNVRAPMLHLTHDDALAFIRREERDWSQWKLVSNLPYSIASPLLVELARAHRGPERMVVTLQAEVAARLMAAPGSHDYGVLTLLVQLNYAPRTSFKIPSSCFFPEPEIDSACVSLVRRASLLLPLELTETFSRVVKRSFSQRRKMMWKLLKMDWPENKLHNAFSREGLSREIRAERVTLEQFVGLTQNLAADQY